MDRDEALIEEALLIRPARIEDRDAILAINTNIYDGIDYIPVLIDKFLTCPSVRSYVATYKGLLIGFCAEQLVDEGHTGIIRAARVHDNMAGKGVYKRLTEYAQDQSVSKVHAFTTSDKNPATDRQTFKQQHVLVGIRDIHAFKIDEMATCKPDIQSVELYSPQKTDASIVRYFLTSQNVRSYLFPYKRIIIYWLPYRLMDANITFLSWHDSVFYNDITEQPNGDITGLLSVSTTFKCKDPSYACMLDIFGSNEGSLQAHVYAHLTEIAKTVSGSFALLVFTEESIRREIVDTVLAGFGISRCPKTREWAKMSKQVVYVKRIS